MHHRHSPTMREMLAENARLRDHIEVMEATIAELKAQLAALRKNSSTSSIPPSSDTVKPPKVPLRDLKA